MRHAETVTFGGAGLDRAGEIRADPAAVAAAAADPAARAILLWRGKPLIARERPASVLRLPMDHPVLAESYRHQRTSRIVHRKRGGHHSRYQPRKEHSPGAPFVWEKSRMIRPSSGQNPRKNGQSEYQNSLSDF